VTVHIVPAAENMEAWADLRAALWPQGPIEEHREEIAAIAAGPGTEAGLIALVGDEPAGLVEMSLRPWVEGCASSPVGFVEGWYVVPRFRRRGVGRALIGAAEAWARARGCTEMGSDTELANLVSQEAHAALGYEEVERTVLFRKTL